MTNSLLSRQVRSVLEALPDAPPLDNLLTLVDDFVLECAQSSTPEVSLNNFEEELQELQHDLDHSSLFQTEVILAVLYHLCPILPVTSVVSWFDLVLRPALREPKLPTTAVNHAKELIIYALQRDEQTHTTKVDEFRRRLLDFYLLDAFNEGSGEDVLEWAELDEDQRAKRTRWKMNLEDILVRFGFQRPQELLTQVYIHFQTPSSRLQLLMLLNLFTSGSAFESSATALATHPLMKSLRYSLLLDNSSTVCTAGLTLLVKMIPFFAVHARETFKLMLPKLLAILARIMCWQERSSPSGQTSADDITDAELEDEIRDKPRRVLNVRPNLGWERLELSFNATASLAPSPRHLYTTLYYLYPCNLIRFLRGPVIYLNSHAVNSPYTVDWDQALDERQIRKKSESLLKDHICHPLLIWSNATGELSQPEFWRNYDITRITSEGTLLDVRNTALALQARHAATSNNSLRRTPSLPTPTLDAYPDDLSSGKISISLQDMVNTSVALKSKVDVNIVEMLSQWPTALFPSSTSPQKGSVPLPSESNDELPSHIAQAVADLQREVLLLRNELNFELWLSRENVKHIGRLYQERIVGKSAEAERQGLYNKLRKYRAQVVSLESQLREHKAQASSAKNKYADWNTELQKKLKEFREEKKAWISEAATLRSAEKDAQTLFAAQGKLLADAVKKVFDLETEKKETQHKIDRLRDYEQRIEQHVKMQRLWDEDFAKFTEREEQMSLMQSQFRQMQMRLESYEKTQIEMDDTARVQRRQIQTLEARLAQKHHRSDSSRHKSGVEIAAFASEKAALTKANNQLREENADLKDEVEEMRAMIEVLKGQHSGRRGLVSEPRASPILYV